MNPENPWSWTDLNPYLFLPPLIVAISVVYAASRFESPRAIGILALRVGLKITFYLAVAIALMLLANIWI